MTEMEDVKAKLHMFSRRQLLELKRAINRKLDEIHKQDNALIELKETGKWNS